MDPNTIIKDYELDPGYTIGDKFTVHVNVSGVSDLFVWQVKMAWNPYVLNVSSIIPGEFLARADPEQTSSEALGWVMNRTENATGTSASAESILGNVSGVSGSGRLVSIEFLILGYNCSDIIISVYGSLPTELLDSTGSSAMFTAKDGYFSNKIWGDIDGDRDVDGFDLTPMCGAYGSEPGEPEWIDACDINRDGIIDGFDLTPACGNYGRSV